MAIPRFELDRWLHRYEEDPREHDLAGSTGPAWTIGEVLALADEGPETLASRRLGYAPAPGSDELRSVIAARYPDARRDDVQVTTGAAEALTILVAANARRGGNVVLPDPGYPAFAGLTAVFGMEPRPYRLRRDDDFRLDPERIAPLIDDQTALLVINTPHNPSGAVVSGDELEALYRVAAARRVTMVVDQVFHPIRHLDDSPSAGELPDVVVVGDMSKALSMPGLRVGWILDRNTRRRSVYFDLAAFFTVSNAPLMERLATIALRHADRVLARAQEFAARNLALLQPVLERHAARVGYVPPSAGLVAFPWFRGGADARPFCLALAERGVVTVPGDCFGHPEHFRIGFGSQEAPAFEAAMKLLDELLGRHPAATAAVAAPRPRAARVADADAIGGAVM